MMRSIVLTAIAASCLGACNVAEPLAGDGNVAEPAPAGDMKEAAGNAELPFTITVTSDNTVVGETYRGLPIKAFSQRRLEEQREGAEKSECEPRYGQKSLSAVAADVRVTRQSPDGLGLELEAASSARGGHFRSCGFCAGSRCVAIKGNDTVGSATSRASARIAVRFAEDLLYNDYEIRLDSAGARDELAVKVTDGAGQEITRNSEGRYSVKASPGSIVFVDVALDAATEAKGGVPLRTERRLAAMDLRVVKAPILALTRGAEPFIVGGDPTSAYPEVVAVILRGDIHCSGTAITPRTILTAAHCIHGYEGDIDRGEMVVQGGMTISQAEWGPIKVAGYSIPDGRNGSIRFNPDRHQLTHDIGVLYVDSPLPAAPAQLHAGQPGWTAIKPMPLYFVGFGYDKLGSTKYGRGVKREASWTVANVDDLRLYFKGTQRSTCRADSGGPAFFIRGGQNPTKLLVGVTSGGDEECTEGFNTRVDAYLAWLKPRLRS